MLQPLLDPKILELALPEIALQIGNIYGPIKWPGIPDKPVFDAFPVRRVIKRGLKGADKSIKGYVWVDTDPLAMLLNKFTIKSCHTLDCVHDYRAGNFNWVFNPYMACIFAGRFDPSRSAKAKSAITNNTYSVAPNGEICENLDPNGSTPLLIRPHQAVANIVRASTLDGSPYIVLCRMYDSCAEYPWQLSMIRYLRAHCGRLGIGFALGSSSEGRYYKGQNPGGFNDYENIGDGKDRLFYTEPYKAFGDRVFNAYNDDDLTLYSMGDDKQYASLSGNIVDYPKTENKIRPLLGTRVDPGSSMYRRFGSSPIIASCKTCGTSLREHEIGILDG